jgi:hypothetical protein
MAGEELKNDLATILDVRAENLVETLTALLSELNDTGVERLMLQRNFPDLYPQLP